MPDEVSKYYLASVWQAASPFYKAICNPILWMMMTQRNKMISVSAPKSLKASKTHSGAYT